MLPNDYHPHTCMYHPHTHAPRIWFVRIRSGRGSKRHLHLTHGVPENPNRAAEIPRRGAGVRYSLTRPGYPCAQLCARKPNRFHGQDMPSASACEFRTVDRSRRQTASISYSSTSSANQPCSLSCRAWKLLHGLVHLEYAHANHCRTNIIPLTSGSFRPSLHRYPRNPRTCGTVSSPRPARRASAAW
jgi:hypothetical protein